MDNELPPEDTNIFSLRKKQLETAEKDIETQIKELKHLFLLQKLNTTFEEYVLLEEQYPELIDLIDVLVFTLDSISSKIKLVPMNEK